MSWLEIDGHHLRVRFTRTEHVLGLVRDQSIPLSSIVSVRLVRSWREATGVRVGLDLLALRRIGTWRHRGRRQLVSLQRGVPALRIELSGEKYDELLISTPEVELLESCLGWRPAVTAPSS
ncbi:hypothetical protein [Nocardioides psychrotolerans]|uniref:hypothetical protein n=1 Tax=Nocardioides psychrotolerans TaxID=1005945 RepID=UPI003137F11C